MLFPSFTPNLHQSLGEPKFSRKTEVLGCPKSLFGFFCKIVQETKMNFLTNPKDLRCDSRKLQWTSVLFKSIFNFSAHLFSSIGKEQSLALLLKRHLCDWAGLCLRICWTILSPLRREEMSAALDLQIGLKSLYVNPKVDTKGTQGSGNSDPSNSDQPILTGSETLSCSGSLEDIWSTSVCPSVKAPKWFTQLQPGCPQKEESLLSTKPCKSLPALSKRKSWAEICLFLLSTRVPSHESVQCHSKI